jgi:hypothetical protein
VLENMLARDGVEPPTPAFSGFALRSSFEDRYIIVRNISVELSAKSTANRVHLGGPSPVLTSSAFTKKSLSLKNGHLHITPETAPRRVNGLTDMAGSRIHIGNIHRRHLGTQVKNALWRHRAPVRPVDA